MLYIVFIASNFLLFYKIDWKDKYICKYMWWLLLYIEYSYNVFMHSLNIFYEFIRIYLSIFFKDFLKIWLIFIRSSLQVFNDK